MMPLPAGTEVVPQVKIRQETVAAVSPLADKMSSCVATVGLTEDGGHRPAELLDSDQDCCFMNIGVLAPEWSPDVSVRGAAVPTPLLTFAEVFYSAVLAGGRCCGNPPGRGRDSHSASVCPVGRWKRTSSGF